MDKHVKELHRLFQQEWWTKKRTYGETLECISNSQICIGIVNDEENLIGFARGLTDYVIKAIIFDVIISSKYRNMGLGDKLIRQIKEHSDLLRVKHFELYCLPEMFAFYNRYGFTEDVGRIKLMRYENK